MNLCYEERYDYQQNPILHPALFISCIAGIDYDVYTL